MIRLRAGDKVFIGGQNGSGKSVLASRLAAGYTRVVVYDPKDDPAAAIPNAALVTTAREVVRRLPGRILYRPNAVEMRDPAEFIDEICRGLLASARRGDPPTSLVVHELGDLTTAYRIGPGLSEVIRKGRSLGVSAILVSQRPQGISVMARSEAQHVACFTLVDPGDRDAMAALMGPLVRDRPLPLDHTWWYRGPDLLLRLMAPVSPIGS